LRPAVTLNRRGCLAPGHEALLSHKDEAFALWLIYGVGKRGNEELSNAPSEEKQGLRDFCDKSAKVFRNPVDRCGGCFYNTIHRRRRCQRAAFAVASSSFDWRL